MSIIAEHVTSVRFNCKYGYQADMSLDWVVLALFEVGWFRSTHARFSDIEGRRGLEEKGGVGGVGS